MAAARNKDHKDQKTIEETETKEQHTHPTKTTTKTQKLTPRPIFILYPDAKSTVKEHNQQQPGQ